MEKNHICESVFCENAVLWSRRSHKALKDDQIVKLIAEKDENGLAGLRKAYGPLFRYVLRPLIKDTGAAEDCLQEIEIAVWTHIEQFDPSRGSLKAWLSTIARNIAVDHAKKLSRQQSEELPEDIESRAPTPQEAAERAELKKALAEAVRALEPKSRTIFLRKYYYRQPVRQIAAELGLTEKSVEMTLYRCRAKLRKMLGGELNE